MKTTSFFTKNLVQPAHSTSTGYQTIQACRERVLKSSVLQQPVNVPIKKQSSPLLVQRGNIQSNKRGVPAPYKTQIRVITTLQKEEETKQQLPSSASEEPSPPTIESE
jgi:hypothetical protein